MILRVAINLFSIITSSIGVITIGHLYRKYFIDGHTSIPISEFFYSLVITFIALTLLGFLITAVIRKFYTDWDQIDTKLSTFGIFIAILFYQFISTRACIPAIFITAIYIILALVPFKFGSKIAEYIVPVNSNK